jgi:hypothetical protein
MDRATTTKGVPMAEHGSCGECHFFEPLGAQGLVAQKVPTGKCRRNAPLPAYLSGVMAVRRDADHWPLVRPDDWCGEFRARRS